MASTLLPLQQRNIRLLLAAIQAFSYAILTSVIKKRCGKIALDSMGTHLSAAFYDLDGTLVKTNLVHALLFQARNQQGILRSIRKTVSVIGSIPLFFATDLYSRNVFQEKFFQSYQGESEDRLRFLSEELFEDVIQPSIYPGAYDLIEQSRSRGMRQVLVTGALDFTVAPLARHLKIDDWITNRLEFVDGFATGQLLPPVMVNATKASWIRMYAEKEGISLNDSYCYTDSISDLPMLSVVGHPTAVHPDFRLRSAALHNHWPILDLK